MMISFLHIGKSVLCNVPNPETTAAAHPSPCLHPAYLVVGVAVRECGASVPRGVVCLHLCLPGSGSLPPALKAVEGDEL